MKTTLSYEELKKKINYLEKESDKRKRIEAQLKESETRFRDIAENALEWIWEIDSIGKYTYSSPVVKQILGYKPNEVVGKFFYDFFHPDEKMQLKKAAFRTFSLKKPFRKFINRNVCKDGKMVVLLTSGVPVLDAKGTLIGYRGADTDITDQYNSEESLRKSEEHLRSLMESATGFTIYRLVYDPNSPRSLRVIFVSPSIEYILGLPEPMKFETWFDSVHPDDVDRITRANQRAFKTRRFDEVYRTYNHKKGEWRWIHAIATGGTRADGWNRYVNGIMIDITDKQEAYEKLKVNEKELKNKTKDLKQMNAALNVLLKKRERDKIEFQDRIAANIKQLVLPYLARIRKRNLESEKLALLNIIESNLNEITATFSYQLSSKHIGLTPTEIKVADLVRQGQKTKQIAQILCLSHKTVESHRESIRKKLSLKNKKINLRSYLMSVE
ncbi:MAG: PAS domain S-box protein [Desulfobacterales bacterium]|jgi:PAS domain S-box-containing protein